MEFYRESVDLSVCVNFFSRQALQRILNIANAEIRVFYRALGLTRDGLKTR